jgi:hypothetical protein
MGIALERLLIIIIMGFCAWKILAVVVAPAILSLARPVIHVLRAKQRVALARAELSSAVEEAEVLRIQNETLRVSNNALDELTKIDGDDYRQEKRDWKNE